jgi:hypothetical protein
MSESHFVGVEMCNLTKGEMHANNDTLSWLKSSPMFLISSGAAGNVIIIPAVWACHGTGDYFVWSRSSVTGAAAAAAAPSYRVESK